MWVALVFLLRHNNFHSLVFFKFLHVVLNFHIFFKHFCCIICFHSFSIISFLNHHNFSIFLSRALNGKYCLNKANGTFHIYAFQHHNMPRSWPLGCLMHTSWVNLFWQLSSEFQSFEGNSKGGRERKYE